MKSVFVDTNILIDLLADRRPFSKFAIDIFACGEQNKVRLFMSSHSYATTHYLLKKYLTEADIRSALLSLLDFITVIPVDLDIIRKSLVSKHKDFEDAIQILAANSIVNIDFIVTRDLKDFKDAGIPVLPPEDLLKNI
jgi:predicted nucleic acid-binding protein